MFACDARERGEVMSAAKGFGDDVLHHEAPHHQRVRDQRAMAPPGDRFRTHHGQLFFPRQFHQCFQAGIKLPGLHVIRKAPEGRTVPAAVGRIAPRVAQSSQPRHVEILDFGGEQILGELFLIELRVVPRTGDRPHIDDSFHAMRLQEFKELLE